jgi:NADPH:quinone reductase-like Zn-dependent oxidoreductase
MKAIRIHSYGDPSVLRYEQAPLPDLAEDDLLIRVIATSVNPVDWKIRQGLARSLLDYPLPLILGWDVSGIVERTGRAVTRFRPGDAVYSRPDIRRNGTYAEFVAVRESEVAPKPATLSHVEAATLPLVSITAWESLFTTGGLQAGQRVLIHAGAGGVGTIAVQLARARGARVTATASAANAALVAGLGADEVIDYRQTPVAQMPRGFDLVFDTIGGATQDASWDLLAPGGMLVSIVSPPAQEVAQARGLRAGYVFIQPNAAILTELGQMVDIAQIRPVVGAEFALKDIRQAHEFSETGRARGKIAIYVSQP